MINKITNRLARGEKKLSKRSRGILYILISMIGFALQGVFVKYLSRKGIGAA